MALIAGTHSHRHSGHATAHKVRDLGVTREVCGRVCGGRRYGLGIHCTMYVERRGVWRDQGMRICAGRCGGYQREREREGGRER